MNMNTFAAEVADQVDEPVCTVKKILRVTLRKLADTHLAEVFKLLERYRGKA